MLHILFTTDISVAEGNDKVNLWDISVSESIILEK